MKRLGNNRLFNILIKLVVLVLLGYVLYYQVFAKEDIGEIKLVFLNYFEGENLNWLIFAILLMPLNWAFETLKWLELIKDIEKLSFWKAFRAILSGVTLSVFTPNRIGEYGGRILFVSPENNWKGVIATLVGSFSQLLVLLAMGLLGLLVFAGNYLNLDPLLLKSLMFSGIGVIGLMLFCFYNVDLIVPVAKRIPFIHRLRKFTKHIGVLRNYNNLQLSKALMYAFLRYMVYTAQYYLLLRFFGISLDPVTAISGIATLFLLQTSIPLPPLMGLMARGELALFIWGIFTESQIEILASSFSLWLLNLILPALFGMIFILNINVLKSLGYEKESS